MVDRAGGEPRYPVRAVMKRTGLSADLLRAWERRYAAVRPDRSAGGQRLYTEDDIARLTLIRRATLAGHSIGEIAQLDQSSLEALFEGPLPIGVTPPDRAVDAIVERALAATERLDAHGVEGVLKRGALSLGAAALVDHVISRFLHDVGQRWHDGTLSPAHEHLASAAVRRVLGWATEAYVPSGRAPRLVVATLPGELHELGAMLVAAAGFEEGWRVVYLGANLPAVNIAAAAKQVGARAVALSIVYGNGQTAIKEAREAARRLPRGTTLFVGGPIAEAHGDTLRAAGIHVLSDIPELRKALRSLRSSARVAR